jgi:hypothetical protein
MMVMKILRLFGIVMMSKKLNLIIFIFVFFTTNLFAVENCSEERKAMDRVL